MWIIQESFCYTKVLNAIFNHGKKLHKYPLIGIQTNHSLIHPITRCILPKILILSQGLRLGGGGGVSASAAGLPILALGMFYCPSLLFCSWPSFSLSSFFLSRDLRLLDSAQCVPHWDTRYMARSSLILPACFPTSYFACVNDPELDLPFVPTGLAGQDSSVSAYNVDL